MLIAIQYLQPEPDLNSFSPEEARGKLRAAGGILPVTHVLVGWEIPRRLLDACSEETRRLGARLYRWQPMLSGDGVFHILPEWRVRNMAGNPVAGYQGIEEFTFVCPNHPSVQYAIQQHLHKILTEGLYNGFFLDRIRFPALAKDPVENLACFCEHCRRKASDLGLDLDEVKDEIGHLSRTATGRARFIKTILNEVPNNAPADELTALERFLLFRQSSITRCVQIVCEQLQRAGVQIGLDGFAPALTNLVGQELRGLGATSDWVKVMTYAHVNAPAGMPFELAGLLDWLMLAGMDEKAALAELAKAVHFKMPSNRADLLREGLSATALRAEVSRGVLAGGAPLLVGIELVEVPGVTQLDDEQIRRDLQAVLACAPAGLALSWDLRHIPLERLKLVSEAIDLHPPVNTCNR